MPQWTYTIRLADVFHNEAMTFQERRDAIAARLRNSQWLADAGEGSTLWYLVDELADAGNTAEFDGPWQQIYDIADADRAWIATF